MTTNIHIINKEEKVISLEEKQTRVQIDLDKMSRTLGIRVGHSGVIEASHNKFKEIGKLDLNLNKENQKNLTLKILTQHFIVNYLKKIK